jgi:L-2-hydroxyglutarate oxidase LhgO
MNLINGSVFFEPNAESIDEPDYRAPPQTFEVMQDFILENFKNISKAGFLQGFYSVRPKVKHEGKVYSDFWIRKPHREFNGYIEALGFESLGLTTTPTIADKIISLFV